VVPLGEEYVKILRGWTSVDVKFRGKTYRFIATHLEAYDTGVRSAQAEELLAAMADSPYPVVLAGDINSLPDDAEGPYGMLMDAGFADAWNEAMGDDPGWTSGQPDDLDCSLPSTIDHRVDYVLHDAVPYLDAVAGTGNVVGDEASDCTTDTDPPLWPSDHAGVAVTLHMARP
jgi:endonuclease/exonuclease/phosphatase family metal-dependent hydrolase